MTYTKEQLIEEAKRAVEGCRRLLRVSPGVEAHKISLRLAEITLASLTAEPVAWMVRDIDTGEKVIRPDRSYFEGSCQPLYTAPPAPVSVPNGRAITQHFDTIALETAREIMCDVNRRHEFLGCEVQLLSRIQCRIDDACRAAMLQGAAGNSPAIPDGWTGSDAANAALIMLDRIETVDSVDDDRIEGIKSIIRGLAAAPQQEAK